MESPHRKKAGGSLAAAAAKSFLSFIFFILLPFAVINGIIFFFLTATPEVIIHTTDTEDFLSTSVNISVSSRLPVREIFATLDGAALELSEEKDGSRTATISSNGLIEVTATCANGMSATTYEHVDILDDSPPIIEDPDITDGVVTVYISDSQSGLNPASVYALNSDNVRVEPISSDPENGIFSYPSDPAGLHILAKDFAGHEVEGTFTTEIEGMEKEQADS